MALPECVVVLSPQYAEATDVFSSFSLMDSAFSLLLVIYLEFQGKSINHFLWHTLFVRLYQSIWLFHPHSTVKIQPFSPVFPLEEFKVKACCRLLLWIFKEKNISHFL